eukprot:6208727-Pleurochrysis_carterae.AAC.1
MRRRWAHVPSGLTGANPCLSAFVRRNCGYTFMSHVCSMLLFRFSCVWMNAHAHGCRAQAIASIQIIHLPRCTRVGRLLQRLKDASKPVRANTDACA